MNYFVYVIKSLSHNTRYIGCSSDVNKRLANHNSGKCRYTKGRRPWQIIYTEKLKTLSAARKREIFLKSSKGREFIDKILS